MTDPLEDFRRETLPDQATRERLRERLEARLARAPAPPRPGPWLQLAIVAAAALVLTLWLNLSPRAAEPPRVEFLASSLPQQVALPDDGQLSVLPGSTAGLEANPHGVRVTLTSGTVGLAVHHVEGKRWVVAVDGFEVVAVGTRFSVRRTGARPEVMVQEGTVRVTGPGLPSEGEAVSSVVPSVEAAAAPSPPVESPTPPAPEPRLELRVDAGARVASSRPARWLPLFRELIESGDTTQAQELIPASAPGQCPGCTAKDLLDLGDLLSGAAQGARAARAYTQACAREPASGSCATAQVRLALQSEQDGRPAEALRWASVYLDRNPLGAFAGELRFRSMEWHLATGNLPLARDDARRVLERRDMPPQRLTRAREVLALP